MDLPGKALVDAAEIRAHPQRIIHGTGCQAEHIFEFVEQLERLERRAVELVHEGENGDAAPAADLEKLAGLRLDALARVDDHDGGIDGRQHAVGVFGKILVARGVEEIDPIAGIIELQDGRGNRNAALAFQFHPIGGGSALPAPGGDRAGQLQRAAVEEEFFGEGGLARVRVTDDGERPAPGDFGGERGDHGAGRLGGVAGKLVQNPVRHQMAVCFPERAGILPKTSGSEQDAPCGQMCQARCLAPRARCPPSPGTEPGRLYSNW
jgi:hypothetical protein